MNKQVVGLASGLLLCAAIAAAQDGRPVAQLERKRIVTGTPEQEAAWQAKREQCQTLDQAGFTALHLGQFSQAEEYARQALALSRGTDLLAPELLPAALDAQGKAEEALKAYQALAERGTVFPRILLPYALLLLKTGHWTQAVEAYNKQLPYLADGDLMAAKSHFSPDQPEPGQLATAIHIALGQTYGASCSWGGYSQDDKALAEFRQALTLAPDSALAHLYYARTLQRMGRRAEAEAAYNKAAELGDGDVKAAVERMRTVR